MIARRGKIRLASEIAVSSAAQVALFVAPLAALLSFLVRPPLPLAFRPVELATIAGSALFVGVVVWDRKGTRREGTLLLAGYVVVRGRVLRVRQSLARTLSARRPEELRLARERVRGPVELDDRAGPRRAPPRAARPVRDPIRRGTVPGRPARTRTA